MTRCERCGAETADGRFCTSCGHPLPPEPTVAISLDGDDDWRTGTAERAAVDDGTTPQAPVPPTPSRPASPPPAAPPMPPAPPAPRASHAQTAAIPGDGPRFPLFADEASAPAQDPAHPGTTTRTPAPEQLAPTPVDDRTPRRWLPWAVVGVGLLLIVLFAVWLVTGPFGSSGDPQAAHGGAAGAAAGGSGGDDLARGATATVPATAPPNEDTSGNMVRYDARQMLDGVPTTCWRMAGDGTGSELTFDLAKQSSISRVGLINGYAKTAPGPGGQQLDWYHGDRRLVTVEWSFDDGTTLTQQLGDSTKMQTVDLDHPVTTSSVQLRLVKVSAPGSGPAARDYTAISDVTLQGSAG